MPGQNIRTQAPGDFPQSHHLLAVKGKGQYGFDKTEYIYDKLGYRENRSTQFPRFNTIFSYNSHAQPGLRVVWANKI